MLSIRPQPCCAFASSVCGGLLPDGKYDGQEVNDIVYVWDGSTVGGNYLAYNVGTGGTDDFTGYIQVGLTKESPRVKEIADWWLLSKRRWRVVSSSVTKAATKRRRY